METISKISKLAYWQLTESMDWVMLSGLSSRMSGLDKGGGLGLYSGDIIDPLLQARVNIGSRLGCLIQLLLIAWSIMTVTIVCFRVLVTKRCLNRQIIWSLKCLSPNYDSISFPFTNIMVLHIVFNTKSTKTSQEHCVSINFLIDWFYFLLYEFREMFHSIKFLFGSTNVLI